MTVTVTYDNYMDYVFNSDSFYKDEYNTLSERAQKKLNEIMNGADFNINGGYNADNVWCNRIATYSNREMLVDTISYLTVDDFNELEEEDRLKEFVDDNQEGIFYHCECEFTAVLDVDVENDEWTVFY